MALTQRLQMRQSQALVMTPQLMQAIKLLALSNLDLTAYVEGELEKNPLLERVNEDEPGVADGRLEQLERGIDIGSDSDGPAGDGQIGGPGNGPGDGPGPDPIGADLETSRGAIEDRLGTALDNVFPDDAGQTGAPPGAESPAPYSEWAGTGVGGREDGDYNLESFVSAAPTLADHLAEQLALAISDPVRRMIGQYLIDMVDEAGYLTGDLASVADKLGTALPEVEAVLTILHGFDPVGVCARNLAECLAIHLKATDRSDRAP